MVSVIIPVYNAAPFVRKAVESAISLAEVTEVILIEDNSPDDSLAVCQALAREYAKVKLLRHPDGGNHGAGASRNLGIRNARGQYIAFLDADDWYLPNRFQTCLPILESRSDVDGVFEAGGVEFEDEAQRQNWITAGKPMINPVLKGVLPDDLLDALLQGLALQTNGFTVRRALFGKTGLFDEHLRLSQDTAMWWKMALIAKLLAGNLTDPVAMRLIHSANRSTDNFRDQITAAQREAWRTLWRWCKKEQIPFGRRRLVLERLIGGEIKQLLRYQDQFRFIERILRLPKLMADQRTILALTPVEILYAYYHVSGLHGLVHHLARLAGKAQ